MMSLDQISHLPAWVIQLGWSVLILLVRYRQEGITIPFPIRTVLTKAVEPSGS